VSRAFDFAGAIARPLPGEPPSAARPYVIELHPDSGHPSLAICAFDLLGAALDGVNAEGLVVVSASDDESPATAFEPAGAAAGLDEFQVVRWLLEGCATAADARAALLGAAFHCASNPAHWLVADRHGDAFVFETTAGRSRVHVVDAGGEPLVATNHHLHRHPPGEPFPHGPDPAGASSRYRALASGLAEAQGPLDAEALSALAARAFASSAVGGPRTLWHGVYDAVERRLSARFFLGGAGGTGPAEAAKVAFQLS
jgi:hypothetical protein